jgi:chemotaxis protein histidine kinase CheA
MSAAEIAARALDEHRSQPAVRRSYDNPDNVSSLRVPTSKVDQFVDLVGGLVTVRARLAREIL